MKVRFKICVFEGGCYYKAGDIADIPESRVKDYGQYVEVLEEKPSKSHPKTRWCINLKRSPQSRRGV